jgi:hypothetical protein
MFAIINDLFKLVNNWCRDIKGLEIMALNHVHERRLRGRHENRSFRRIIQSAYKFLAGPLCFSFSAINHTVT